MRWQKLLTKEQLTHLRWSRSGEAPTLTAFIELREAQENIRVSRAKKHLYDPVCCLCDQIETRLKEGGKL
jgi:hypothetical protein